MSIKNKKITITDGSFAFRIDIGDAVEAFETITRKDIVFSVAYDDNSLVIYPPRDELGDQHSIDEIHNALDAK